MNAAVSSIQRGTRNNWDTRSSARSAAIRRGVCNNWDTHCAEGDLPTGKAYVNAGACTAVSKALRSRKAWHRQCAESNVPPGKGYITTGTRPAASEGSPRGAAHATPSVCPGVSEGGPRMRPTRRPLGVPWSERPLSTDRATRHPRCAQEKPRLLGHRDEVHTVSWWNRHETLPPVTRSHELFAAVWLAESRV